ncbi:hypothetical protein [Gordoniibacillus kamchatkensis]|uniref:hypothetical protein n=1 Tax=Gordoniibacillus kamchatkensis TaxID=1590651 RepID=UPI000A551BE0|nr:hypothetical protein [Paenibacillus sp. VKM B-2647]
MVIDDGWQCEHDGPYNGGPWHAGNGKFPDMPGLAARMRGEGTLPGIWCRPLLTKLPVPSSWLLPNSRFAASDRGRYLDPSVPEALQLVADDIARFRAWGYDLVKYDFTTYDILGRWGFQMGGQLTNGGWRFADGARTTAEIIAALYRTIREAAGPMMLIGCNTVGHLAAGHVELQRTGDDTSGRVWERTRKYGVNTLAFRMPQHGAFFAVDADCVGLTRDIPWRHNAQWLDALAGSGTPLFVSAARDAVGAEQERALREAFRIASRPQSASEPLDWLDTTCPRLWRCGEETRRYDWTGADGIGAFE